MEEDYCARTNKTQLEQLGVSKNSSQEQTTMKTVYRGFMCLLAQRGQVRWGDQPNEQSTCQIHSSACQTIPPTCQVIMSTCHIIMSTCQKIMSIRRKVMSSSLLVLRLSISVLYKHNNDISSILYNIIDKMYFVRINPS